MAFGLTKIKYESMEWKLIEYHRVKQTKVKKMIQIVTAEAEKMGKKLYREGEKLMNIDLQMDFTETKILRLNRNG